MKERRVVCAAVRFGGDDGMIFTGPRHFDKTMLSIIRYWPHRLDGPEEQGFIDQEGNFLTREEAWVVATDACQIIRRVGGDGSKLFSENLY